MPRVDPAAPTVLPQSPPGISFPATPNLADPGPALFNLGQAIIDRQKRINRDELLIRAQEATADLETEIFSDPSIPLADAAEVFSERLSEAHEGLLEEAPFLGRDEAARALRANAAVRAAGIRREAFNRQQAEIRRQVESKELLRLQRFAAAETDEERSLLAEAHELDLSEAVNLGVLVPEEAQLRSETFRRTGTELSVDALAAQGRFEEAKLLVSTTPGLDAAAQSLLNDKIARAEDADLTREYNLQQRAIQTEARQQILNYRNHVARLADDNQMNDPSDQELLTDESLGLISPSGRAELIRMRDDSGGARDDTAYLQATIDVLTGTFSDEQAISLANKVGGTRSEKQALIDRAIGTRTALDTRPDLRRGIEQFEELFKPAAAQDVLAGKPVYAQARVMGLAALQDAITSSTTLLSDDEVAERVRVAFARSIPNSDLFPSVLPQRLGSLLPVSPTPVAGGAPGEVTDVPLDRPRDIKDIPQMAALIDALADPRQPIPIFTLEEASRAHDALEMYRVFFSLSDAAERLAKPLPAVPERPTRSALPVPPPDVLAPSASEPLLPDDSPLGRLGRRIFPFPTETP